MAVDSQVLGEIAAITKKHVSQNIPDNLKKVNYFYNAIMKEKVKIDGGSKITLPFKGAANTASMKSINGTTDVIDRNISQQLFDAEFDWVYKYTSVNFTLDEMARTIDSPQGWKKYFKAKKQGAMNDGVRQFTQNLYGSRDNAAAGALYDPKGFNGLYDVFAPSGTAYGGFADTAFSDDAWNPTIATGNQVITYNVLSPLITAARARCEGSDQQTNLNGTELKIDLIVSNSYLFSQFKIAEQAQQRYSNVQVKDAKDVNIGWNMYDVDGVKWMIDDFAPGSKASGTYDNWLMVLPTAAFILQCKYGLGMGKSPVDTDNVRIPNQTIIGSDSFFAGALTTAGRRNMVIHKTLA
jgi:hypothetical protein